MAGSYLPLATAAVVAILAATSASAVPSAAAADKYSGRMVIIRAPGARVLADVSAGGAALNKWQQQRRLVEDEVAPEFGGDLQLGAGSGGVAGAALNKERPTCLPSGECAKTATGSYTRGCTYPEKCSQ